MANKAEINVKKSLTGATPLILACERGDIDIVNSLLENGADVRIKNTYGYDALGTAMANIRGSSGKADIVRALLEKGANPNEKYKDGTPLIIATLEGKQDMVDILLAKGANADDLKQMDKYLYTRAKEKWDADESLYDSKVLLDKLLTRFPSSSYKLRASALLKNVNNKIAIIEAIENGESDIRIAISSQEFGKAWAALHSIKKYISGDKYNEHAKEIDDVQNKPVNVTVLDLLSDKSNYAYKKVIVKGYMCYNLAGAESFDLVDSEGKCTPRVSVSYGDLPSNTKKSLLTKDPVPERSHISVEVIGVFDGDDRITAIDVSL